MNLEKYPELKAQGLIEVRDGYLAQKKFDPETGKPTAPEIQTVTKEQLQKQRAKLLELINSIDTIIADLEAMQSPKPLEE